MPRILSFSELKPKGIVWCRDHLRRKIEAGEFPRPVPLSTRRVGWLESEINVWLEGLVEKRDQTLAAKPTKRIAGSSGRSDTASKI